MDRILAPLARLAMALWVGAVAGVAFIVAPRVFRFLDDPQQAGELMRPIFARIDYFGIVAGLLFLLAARTSKLRAIVAGVLAAAAAVNVWGIASRVGDPFFHRLSVMLWGGILVGGVFLVLIGPGRKR